MMARLVWVIGVPLAALSLIGLVWGDPRAAAELSRADLICAAAFLTAVAAALIAWRSGRREKQTSGWWLPPTVILAISGGLCGWIAAAEFTYQPDVPVRLAQMPLRAIYMVAATALGMALPALAVTALASRLTPRGTART
jgi:hypothetical protein